MYVAAVVVVNVGFVACSIDTGLFGGGGIGASGLDWTRGLEARPVRTRRRRYYY